jgi:hypothetical protein
MQIFFIFVEKYFLSSDYQWEKFKFFLKISGNFGLNGEEF